MSARSLSAWVATTLGAFASALLLCCAPAPAAMTHNFLSSLGTFQSAEGLAVKDSTDDVYVYDTALNGRILKFDSSGNPLEFAAIKSDAIENLGNVRQIAVDNSGSPAKGDLYLVTETGVSVYSPSGEPLGELNANVSTEVPGAPWGSSCGVAVDAEGNVYVGLGEHISKYAPTSNPVSNTDYVSSLSGLHSACKVAADSLGSVYTIETVNGVGSVWKYDASQFGALDATGTRLTEKSSEAVAVNLASNELYLDMGSEIVIYDSAGNVLERIQPTGESPAVLIESSSVAVSGATGDVYASTKGSLEQAGVNEGRVVAFGPAVVVPDVTTGIPVPTTSAVTLKGTVNPDETEAGCYFEYGKNPSYGQIVPCASSPGSGSSPVEVSAEIGGLEPAVHYHFRLVTTNSNGTNAGEDETFVLPFPPVIENEWSSKVAVSTAEVEASVSPMGYETTLHVEYGTDTSYGTSVPVPDIDIGAGSTAKTFSEPLAGLRPGTTYHYRVVASSAIGTIDSPDKSFTMLAEPPGEQADSCPNATYRTGTSAQLPDCRAYEMVSPIEKNGADINASFYKEFVASKSGDAIEFVTRTGMSDTQGSGSGGFTQFVARRGATGWSTKAVTPTPAQNSPEQAFKGTYVLKFSEELDRAVVEGYALPGVTGAPADTQDLYLEETEDARLMEPITRFEGFEEPISRFAWQFFRLGSTSSDLGVVTFETKVNLVPQATGTAQKLYELEHGHVKLVGILPDGSVLPGGSKLALEDLAGHGLTLSQNDSVSRDGSRIFFYSPGKGARQLYMRKNGTSTVWISLPEGATSVTTPENVTFQAATPDGTKVVFSTSDRLLGSDPGGAGTALYMYTDSPDPESESNLTFITRFGSTDEGMSEGEVVKGISDDGSHVYFSSEGLADLPFKTETEKALFLWDNGKIRQVAPLPGPGEHVAYESFLAEENETWVSNDGRRIAFMNKPALTGQDILGLGEHDMEIYVYDEGSDTLKCVSCPPTGAAVTVGAERKVEATEFSNPGFGLDVSPRFFSRDGHYVFFNTPESLVSQDTNQITDAYEYNMETGGLSLLSSGTGDTGTWFVDASADGKDVFLATRQALSLRDPDKLVDLYDARMEGGLPEPPQPLAPCAGDACQGTPSAQPSFNTASEFNGLGNPASRPLGELIRKSLTRAQLLKRALSACQEKPKRKRAACRSAAHKRYAAKPQAKKSVKRSRRAGR